MMYQKYTITGKNRKVPKRDVSKWVSVPFGNFLNLYAIKLWARRMVIGKDSEGRQEELRNFARDIILEKKIPDKMEDVEATIINEGRKITCVRMEINKTILTLKPGGRN